MNPGLNTVRLVGRMVIATLWTDNCVSRRNLYPNKFGSIKRKQPHLLLMESGAQYLTDIVSRE